MKEIYFAGGCFWGIDELMSRQKGVIETASGYANGHIENPTYEQVCTGRSGHAETVKVVYDEEEVELEYLLNKFWKVINPTTLDRQGPDMGNQYRSGIYYVDEADLEIINKTLEEQKEKYDEPIVTEIKELESFYLAEEYHQDYFKKHPHRFCHIDLNA